VQWPTVPCGLFPTMWMSRIPRTAPILPERIRLSPAASRFTASGARWERRPAVKASRCKGRFFRSKKRRFFRLNGIRKEPLFSELVLVPSFIFKQVFARGIFLPREPIETENLLQRELIARETYCKENLLQEKAY